MAIRSTSLILIFILTSFLSIAQEKKKREVNASRIDSKIDIDGILDEPAWEKAEIADKFITRDPNPGQIPMFDTQVKMLYDDEAVYIGVFMPDNYSDSILREMTLRDNVGNTDFFAVSFDFYQDGLNGVEYGVTASGVQFDTKFSDDDSDRGWNAVWLSEVRIAENGWYAEMKIPYSAMRFAEGEEQVWHVNFTRSIRRTREQSWWSEMDPAIGTWFGQYGLTKGIKDIEPPTRLFLFPYVSYYAEHFPINEQDKSNWSRSLIGGLDVKYGINDAFTLDMTLVPDFGQVVSDNQVLNLTPFEVVFDENRQFFIEGTELFNKADIFFTRRIGGTPINFHNVAANLNASDSIINNPAKSQLINAAKVSGRTEKGLGIGVFNAVTSETNATVINTESGQTRDILTDPLTNYNVFVFDQNLWTNASVSLINTSVFRSGSTYDANVTGTQFRLPDKKNEWVVNGTAVLSQKYYSDSTDLGSSMWVALDNIAGNANYGIRLQRVGRQYDPNDLGINFQRNFSSINSFYSWRTLEPIGKFNRLSYNISSNYSRNIIPNHFADFAINWSTFAMTRGFTAFGLNGRFEPIETFDFFEPRVAGRFYEYPKNYRVSGFISSDYRKRFAGDIEFGVRRFNDVGRFNNFIEFRPRIRVTDKFFINGGYTLFKLFNDEGWAEQLSNGEIVFGIRDREEQTTTLNFRYIFSPLMGITFRGRYYWSTVEYDSFHALDEDGRFTSTSYTGLNSDGVSLENNNFNAFTIDTQFTWTFTPGSELSFVWKNNIFTSDPILRTQYLDNLNYVLNSDQLNSFSLRLLYFIDYNKLKSKL